MKIKISLFTALLVISCSHQNPVHSPVEGLDKEDMSISQNRAKQLNQIERAQISQWISEQKKSFYPTSLNYWSDIEHLEQRPKKEDGTVISFQYELLDFEQNPFYPKPKVYQNVVFGKFEELGAIENALRYLKVNEETTLLVPSVLAFGTFGDGDQIPHDMPLIIRLKRTN